MYILGFFHHPRGLSLATLLGLEKQYLSSIKRFVFSSFKEFETYAHTIPSSHRFHHVVCDFQPNTLQLEHIQNVIKSKTWSGEKITFSFLWHGHGLLYASSVCLPFDSIDVTVIARGMSSPGIGGLNCLLNMLSGHEQRQKKVSICFEKGRYTEKSLMTEENYITSWPSIQNLSFSQTTFLETTCRTQLEQACPNAVISLQ